ncbi:MAG: hypothetical protein B7Z09_00150 [Brevundimonas diminuta]|nr:MAG: hypothetical protein B7Z09_00150 [Brevundimonas diminuta]
MNQDIRKGEFLSMVQESAQAFVAHNHSRDRLRAASPSLWGALVDVGLTAALLPETDGGAEIGAVGVVRLTRLFGRALLPEPYVALALVPSVLALAMPRGEQRNSLISGLTSEGGASALCWQEHGNAIDAWSSRSRLIAGRLSGQKILSPLAEHLLVTAETDGQPVLAAVHCGEAGVSVKTRSDLGGGIVADIGFQDAPMSEIVLEGQLAKDAVERALAMGALATAAQLLGVAEGLNALTLEHLSVRQQFGRPLGSFQALQHRAVDLHMATALGEASVEQAAELYDADPDGNAARAAISAAKARACEAAALASREAIQLHGAIGFTEESDVSLFVRAILGLTSRFGGALAHRRRFLALGGDANA